MTTTTLPLRVGFAPPWSRRLPERAAPARPAARAEAPPLPRQLRVPLVDRGQDWFWEGLETEQAVEPASFARIAGGRRVWLLAAVPLLAPLQLAALYALNVPVPVPLVVLTTVAAAVLLTRADRRALRAGGCDLVVPRALLALPPAYLGRRNAATADPMPALVSWLLLAAAVLGGVAVADRAGPVALSPTAVEQGLYLRVFDGSIPLDPATVTVRCGDLRHVWRQHPSTCELRDATTTRRVEVTPGSSPGSYRWRLPA